MGLRIFQPSGPATKKAEGPSRLDRLRHAPVFESLQYREFRWLWVGSFASFMAMNMQMITRGWLVLRLADDSPLALALVMMSFSVPMTFVALVGGALADRIPRRRMIMVSQGGNVVLTLLLATLDFSGLIAFWHLLVIGFFNGSFVAMNMPSRQAIISESVPEDRLMNAISLNNSAMNLTRILGPALAGVLIVFIDTAGVFYLIGVIYVASILSVTMVRVGTQPTTRSGKGVFGEIGEGFRYARRDPTLRGLIIMAFIPVWFGFSYFALLPAWAKEALDVGPEDLGGLMAIMGVGALVGSMGLAAMRNFNHRGMLLLVASLTWGVSLAIFSQTTSYAVAVPFLLLIGLLSAVYMSLNMTLTQVYAAPEMRGRVMSFNMMTFGMMPLAAVPFGAIAESTGTPDADNQRGDARGPDDRLRYSLPSLPQDTLSH